jgi:hypothetical protein
MSLTVFIALGILGIDLMIYVLFKRMYGEKHRTRRRELPADYIQKEQASPLHVSPARKVHPTEITSAGISHASFSELLAYRRIVASFAQAKSRV